MGVTSLRAIAAALTLAASRQRAAARPFKALVWKNRCMRFGKIEKSQSHRGADRMTVNVL